MNRGKFIVFEGIDGSGSTTQIKLSAPYVFDKRKDVDVFITREPTRHFGQIRRAMAQQQDPSNNAKWYKNVFIPDRRQHYFIDIGPKLFRGTDVLCNRFKLSTDFYQHLQGIPIEELEAEQSDIPEPDLYLVIDCPAPVAAQRIKKRGEKKEVFEQLDFQIKLRDLYLSSRHIFPDKNIVIIDGNRPVDVVFEEVKTCLDYLLLIK